MTEQSRGKLTENLHELVELFILGDEPCIGFYESKIIERGFTVYEFQDYLINALKLQEKINQKDLSIWKDALETVEKIQFGKELDKWDSSNLQYTIEDTIRFIIKHIESEKEDNV